VAPGANAGTNGYVAAEFVGFDDHGATAPPPVATRAGWVANTDGARLRVRTAPRVDAEIVTRLEPGWRVTILEGPLTAADGSAWVRLEHGGITGYAAAAFVAGSAAGGGDLPAPPSATPTTGTPSTTIRSGRAVDQWSGWSPGPRLRDQPALGPVITLVTAGTIVERTGRRNDR
jgi:hypothetical protein